MKLIELSLFYSNLAELTSAGIPVTTIFESLRLREKSPERKQKLKNIHENIQKGRSLALSLKQSDLLPIFDIPILEAGEKAGNLPTVLKILAKNYQESSDAEKNIRSGLYKPFFIFAAALFLPSFPDLFLGKITLTRYLIQNFSVLIVLGFASFSAYSFFMKSYYYLDIAKLRHRIFLSVPFLNGLTHKISQEKFCNSLALMLEAGLPIFEALTLAGNTSVDDDIRLASRKIIADVKTGKSLHEAFQVHSVFNDDIKNSVYMGAESGKLPHFLFRSSQMLKQEISIGIEKISKFIPQFIYWLTVLFAAFTILSFYVARVRMLNQILMG